MLSPVELSNISRTLDHRGDSLWQRGDTVLDVDPPACAHLTGPLETPSSGMGTSDAVRAVQEPQGPDQGSEPINRGGKFSSSQENTSTVSAVLMTINQWLPDWGKRYRDDRNKRLVIETRECIYPQQEGPPLLKTRSRVISPGISTFGRLHQQRCEFCHVPEIRHSSESCTPASTG